MLSNAKYRVFRFFYSWLKVSSIRKVLRPCGFVSSFGVFLGSSSNSVFVHKFHPPLQTALLLHPPHLHNTSRAWCCITICCASVALHYGGIYSILHPRTPRLYCHNQNFSVTQGCVTAKHVLKVRFCRSYKINRSK